MKTMLCEISHALADLVHEQINNLDEVDSCEICTVSKAIKNLQEAIYYHEMVENMKTKED